MSELPDLTAWTACVGGAFCLQLDGGAPVDLTLIEATALPAQPGAPRQEPFILIFRGPATCLLSQATHTLQHERLGELALFLVPAGADEEGAYYQAVFN